MMERKATIAKRSSQKLCEEAVTEGCTSVRFLLFIGYYNVFYRWLDIIKIHQ
jgi:hypothetical protein